MTAQWRNSNDVLVTNRTNWLHQLGIVLSYTCALVVNAEGFFCHWAQFGIFWGTCMLFGQANLKEVGEIINLSLSILQVWTTHQN
jgi:hypothetical protein